MKSILSWMEFIIDMQLIGHKEMWLALMSPISSHLNFSSTMVKFSSMSSRSYSFHVSSTCSTLHPRYSIIYVTDYKIFQQFCCEFDQNLLFSSSIFVGFFCCFKYQYGTNSKIHVLVFYSCDSICFFTNIITFVKCDQFHLCWKSHYWAKLSKFIQKVIQFQLCQYNKFHPLWKSHHLCHQKFNQFHRCPSMVIQSFIHVEDLII
jgi:hypothetical protein